MGGVQVASFWGIEAFARPLLRDCPETSDCFGYIGDFTTKIYREYRKQLLGSLLNNQDSMESRRVFFVALLTFGPGFGNRRGPVIKTLGLPQVCERITHSAVLLDDQDDVKHPKFSLGELLDIDFFHVQYRKSTSSIMVDFFQPVIR